VCVKSGKAEIVESPNSKRKQLNKITVEDDSDNEAEYYDELNAIASVTGTGRCAVLYAVLNGRRTRMLYDPGAAFSVINRHVWQRIGSPSLSPMPNLLAYTKVPIRTLGSATIVVDVFKQQKTLKVCVVDTDDTPLFGLDWLLAFEVALPAGVEVRAVTSSVATQPSTTEKLPEVVTSLPAATDSRLRQLLEEYADIFQSGHGTIKCQQAVVHIDPTARPKAFAARPVPFPMRKAVEAELDRLTSEGILEPVDPMVTPIEWASPIVIAMKTNGTVRICGDFKVTINPHIIRDSYPLPRFEEIAAKLNNCRYFSVLDLKDAYLQLPVAEASRKYFIIATHMGYFRYTRLAFGVNFAPAVFQATMDKILAGMQSTSAYIDDIISGSESIEQHLDILRSVFSCLRQAGVRIQLSKCRFMQTSVEYLGHRIDAEGVHPTDERLRAVRDMARPEDRKQLRSFLGAINYYAKFIPHLQSTCAPLHRLTRNDTPWQWTTEHDVIFTGLKERLTSSDTLVHYDDNKPLVIATDASDIGLGAVLMHRFPDGSERPIAYASRLLSDCEKRYATIDKEALAIIFAVNDKFQQYVMGRRFVIKTDHRPLERLLGAKTQLPKLAAGRLARWAMTLSMYNYEIQYHDAGSNTQADMLSRFPVDPAEGVSTAEKMGKHSNLLHLKLQDISISRRQLKQKTICDAVLSQVIANMERGWPSNVTSLPKELHTFFEKRAELSVEEDVLLWRGRLVIPTALKESMLQMLHEGHPGVCAMRELARFYAWWPCIDDDIEHHVAACSACQKGRAAEPEVPLFSWSVPSEPWSRIHLDFAGPFEGFMWLIAVDAYTKWLDVIKMKSTTATATCNKLRELFARYGVPRVLVSDNGPQWISEEFQQFCASNLIQSVLSSPYHPKTNGLAERAVRTFKERMMAAKASIADPSTRLQKFLMSYRNTPHKSTGRPPAELMFGRRLRTRLDLLKPDVRARLDAANFRQQRDHDQRTTPRSFAEGDPVWVVQTSGSGHKQGIILRRTGPLSYWVNIDGVRTRKHADQLRFRRANNDNHVDIDDDMAADGIQQSLVPLPLMPSPVLQAPVLSAGESTAALPVQSSSAVVLPSSDSSAADAAPVAAAALGRHSVASKQRAQHAPAEELPLSADSDAAAVALPVRRSQRTRRFPVDPYAKYL
jgi:transposase InsO family protein